MATVQVANSQHGWFPEWEARPLMIGAASLLIAIVASVPMLVGSVAILTVLFWRKWLWVIGFAALGFTLRPVPPTLITQITSFDGRVQVVSTARRTVYRTSVFVEHRGKKFRMNLPPGKPISIGSVYQVTGELKPTPDTYANYEFQQGISGWLEPKSRGLMQLAPGPWWAEIADQLPRHFHEYLRRFSFNQGALIEALVTGQDGYIERDIREEMRQGGVLHLIAASGMQVQALAAVAAFLFSRLPIPRVFQILALILWLILYSVIAGLSVAVLRAVIMVTVEKLAPFCRKRYDSLSALGFAAIVVLTNDPRLALGPGFYLSFGGMLGILLVGGLLANLKRWRQVSGESLAGAFATAPITAIFFGGVSTYGAIATLCLSYVAAGIMAAGLIAFLLHQLGFSVGLMILEPCLAWMADTFLAITRFFAKIPGAYFLVPSPYSPAATAIAICTVLYWRPTPVETKS